jgi:F-type H+-transporting ATPase subunit b
LISVDATALIVMVLVFALVLVLKNLFFEPLAQAMETRQDRIDRAASAWDDAQKTILDASQRVNASVQSARNEGYGRLDASRTEAQVKARSEVDQARAETQERIASARKTLHDEAERAIRELENQADSLAASIAARILGRDVA